VASMVLAVGGCSCLGHSKPSSKAKSALLLEEDPATVKECKLLLLDPSPVKESTSSSSSRWTLSSEESEFTTVVEAG
jgi:hypothetical protein